MPARTPAVLLGLTIVFTPGLTEAQPPEPTPIMLVLGDSLGEGVQSADASERTQPSGFASVLAAKLGVALPLIQSGPFGIVGSTTGRARVNPGLRAGNLAVSGMDVDALLRHQADGVVDSETDLVLAPRLGSQIEIAESLGAPFVVCWIGSNDVLSAVTSYDNLDASQLTPVAEFAADFGEVVARLTAAGSVTLFANIPDVVDTAFLLDGSQLARFLGSDFGLPDGHLTTLWAMILVQLGQADGTLFQNPSFVLDPGELALIQARISAFNQIIDDAATAAGLPVADIHGVFKAITQAEPLVFGVPLTSRYLGGLFSLDGLHPSNLGHAIIASVMIATINQHFGVAIPNLTLAEWTDVFLSDPFIDKDGDGLVTGRPNAGFLETLAPLLGFSGDANDQLP